MYLVSAGKGKLLGKAGVLVEREETLPAELHFHQRFLPGLPEGVSGLPVGVGSD